MCQTALKDFQTIRATVGGERDKESAGSVEALLHCPRLSLSIHRDAEGKWEN